MTASRRAGTLLTIAALVALTACTNVPQKQAKTGSPSAGSTAASSASSTAASPSEIPATPDQLAAALVTTDDVAAAGVSGMVVQAQDMGDGLAGSGPSYGMVWVSGDVGCQAVLGAHPVPPQAWAAVWMAETATPGENYALIAEEVDSYSSTAEAMQVMQQNRDQVDQCHSFVGVNQQGGAPLTFTHSMLSTPALGDEAVAHELSGVSPDGTATWLLQTVEIRSGSDVIFIDNGGTFAGEATTDAIATAAMTKYGSAL